MRQRRLKILDKNGAVRSEITTTYDDGEEDLSEWVSSRIPPVPSGRFCEDQNCAARQAEFEDGEEREFSPELATTYVWRIEGGHVCFTYVCDRCDAAAEGELEAVEPGEYPTTDAGYAVAPSHCA